MNRFIAEFYGTFLLILSIVGTNFMLSELGAPDYIVLIGISFAVALILFANITIFSKVSGAHFNPVVSMYMFMKKNIGAKDFLIYSSLQILGAISAVVFAHLTFGIENNPLSLIDRSSNGIVVAEFLGTMGLLLGIIHSEKHAPNHVPAVVSTYIFSAVLFTASTCFANPAVTISRMFTSSAVGIDPYSALLFITVEILAVIIVSKAID